MKAVLAVYNSKYIHSGLAPWCLAAGLREYAPKTEWCVTEGTINQNFEVLAEKIAEQNPQVVGFSVYIWNVVQTLKAVKWLKEKMPQCKIVLGGPEVSYHAAQVLEENPCVDYILSGEGEESFAALCNAIQQGKDPVCENIAGLCARINGKAMESEPAMLMQPPPNPYGKEYFEALQGRICYIETTRGCPYRCAFCLSGRCGKVKSFDLEEMKQRIAKLAQSGTKTVKFVDRTFNASPARAAAIWRWILQEYGKTLPSGVCFHFEIAGDILTEEQFELLEQMPLGAVQLEIGLQSFYEPTLQAIHRKTDCAVLQKNIRRLAQPKNIHLHIDLIAGLPLETLEIFGQSFNTAFALRPQMLQLGFLKLLYGADMREYPEEYPCRFSPEPPYQVIDTPWISQQELQFLHRLEDVVEKLYNSGRFCKTVEYLLDCTQFSAFGLFGRLAKEDTLHNMGLDEYTAKFYQQAKQLPNVQEEQLRDVMCVDRLESNGTGKLPLCLQREDANLKQYKTALQKIFPVKKGEKRGVAVLYGQDALAWVDYGCPVHPVTARRTAKTVLLDELLKEEENDC